MAKDNYVWLIAHIDSSKVDRLKRDIDKFPEYQIDLEAHVPMIRILKKHLKGKDEFNEVPLLFNYGFFRVPYLWAINKDILDIMKNNITCIFSWVIDPAKGGKPTKKKKKKKEEPLEETKSQRRRRLIPYAYCDEETVKRMISIAKKESIHSSADINDLKPGNIINLMGYPFEGMEATVVSVDKRSKRVIVEIGSLGISREVNVSFDNVFYSIYGGSYDEAYRKEKPLEENQINKNKGHGKTK